jgi:hypothetical protein
MEPRATNPRETSDHNAESDCGPHSGECQLTAIGRTAEPPQEVGGYEDRVYQQDQGDEYQDLFP